ncbi:hypothetical protein DFH06DRAFT_1331410 [Mycena polygramma]|nr:hypothetical protein DFH06DRAFT_1331410 [Mycena polygramma]
MSSSSGWKDMHRVHSITGVTHFPVGAPPQSLQGPSTTRRLPSTGMALTDLTNTSTGDNGEHGGRRTPMRTDDCLVAFVTPIDRRNDFFTIPEYEQRARKPRRGKGLGTSKDLEARNYSSHMEKHMIPSPEDERNKWLSQRSFLSGDAVDSPLGYCWIIDWNYSEFINKEMPLFRPAPASAFLMTPSRARLPRRAGAAPEAVVAIADLYVLLVLHLPHNLDVIKHALKDVLPKTSPTLSQNRGRARPTARPRPRDCYSARACRRACGWGCCRILREWAVDGEFFLSFSFRLFTVETDLRSRSLSGPQPIRPTQEDIHEKNARPLVRFERQLPTLGAITTSTSASASATATSTSGTTPSTSASVATAAATNAVIDAVLAVDPGLDLFSDDATIEKNRRDDCWATYRWRARLLCVDLDFGGCTDSGRRG